MFYPDAKETLEEAFIQVEHDPPSSSRHQRQVWNINK